jgi:thioredoxin reductase (NADPH)
VDSVEAVDCLIVGGGPAGLTAAIYLGRFRRSVVLIDAGESRLKLIPMSRNIPGFPDGVAGKDLHARMRQQASRYDARLLDGEVTSLRRTGGRFRASSSSGEFVARTVLLATGVSVATPALDDLDGAVQHGLIRYCPICDGFEAAGASVAVLGGRPHALDEAHFLRTYVDDLTFVSEEGSLPPSGEIDRARKAGIEVEKRSSVGMKTIGDRIEIAFSRGAPRQFDIVYPCLGVEARSDLAHALGA